MTSSPPAKILTPIFKKKWFKIVCGLFLVLSLLVVAAPMAAKYYLIDWLVKNGAETAQIEKLRFNPFTGKLSLGGMNVTVAGDSILKNADMVVNVRLLDIFKKDIRIESAVYTDLLLDLQQFEDGRWRFASYTMAASETKNEENNSETINTENNDVPKEAAKAWAFLADSILLQNCEIRLKTPELSQHIVIKQAQLSKFSTRNNSQSGSLNIEGTVNGQPIAINLEELQIVPELQAKGSLNIEGLDLADYSSYLQETLPVFKGKLNVEGDLNFALKEDGNLLTDYRGIINLQDSTLGAEFLETTLQTLQYQGSISYTQSNSGSKTILTDGALTAEKYKLHLAASDFKTSQSSIEFTGQTNVTITDSLSIEHEGALVVKDIQLKLPTLDLKDALLQWDGQTTYTLGNSDAGQQIKLDGTLSSNELDIGLPESEMSFRQEKLEVSPNLQINLKEDLSIEGVTDVISNGFTMAIADNDMVAFHTLEINEIIGFGGKKIEVKDVRSTDFLVNISGNTPLKINLPEIKLQQLSTEDLLNFNLATFELGNSQIISTLTGQELAGFAGLNLENISYTDPVKVQIGKVYLHELSMLSEEIDSNPTPLKLSALNVEKVAWSGTDGLDINSIDFVDLSVLLVRDKTGEINIAKNVMAMSRKVDEETKTTANSELNQQEPLTAKPNQEEAPQKIKLRQFTVSGNSVINFEDYTLAVPYITDLAIKELTIDGLDSEKPEEKTTFKLLGDLEKRAPLELTGHILPFLEKPDLKLKLKLKNYPLSSLSSYTLQAVGTELDRGQLKLKTKFEMSGDIIDMENTILLKGLETKTISEELAQELNNQLPIPLDAALSILRDSDGNISLDIPLSGPVDELNVGISDVLITALGKAIVPAASGYLMYALGPYGALAYVGMKVGENILKVDLPPVTFVIGDSALSEEHDDYLKRVAKILEDRPETDLQICPHVGSWEFLTEKDIEGFEGRSIAVEEDKKDDLLQLGQQRGENIKQYLSEKYEVADDRLLICDTQIEEKKSAKPEVRMHL